MKYKYIIFFISLFGLILTSKSQDSKKITNKFFPDFDITIPTPAFKKNKGFTKYDEMMLFLDDLVNKYPKLISYEFIGTSQKGKEIPIVYIGNQTDYKTKVAFMGGLHGNEPASTEGMLFLIHNLIKEDSLKHLKEKLSIAIIPMANIDGYEKQDRYAANGQDLNRDQTKFTNQESIYIKKAINKFSPDVMVDFHEYKPYKVDFVKYGEYGVTQMFDVMFLYSGNLNVSSSIKEVTENLFLKKVEPFLDKHELKYHNYVSSKHKNNAIYFNLGSVSPRSSATSYALSNTISLLMEVRGVGLNRDSFNRRVFTTYLLSYSFLNTSVNHAHEIQLALEKANNFNDEIIIKYKKEKSGYTLNMIDIYENKLIPVDVTLYNGLKCKPVLTRRRPNYYVIENELNEVASKLSVLGLDIDTLKFDELLEVESYKITSLKKSPVLFQGFYENIINTELYTTKKVFKKGTFIVPMNQKRSNLAIETLEPEMLSGFLRFNVIKPDDVNKIHRYVLNKEL
ncbi:MAG: peptidase [Crocinitomicaceae bacterium]|nr:peptidase [Crocinitomicaceae bacterium]